ncbi:MP17L protein, partial [Vireo altiloquus]|nr:MP17L protein [Vireo altiloquus]
MAGALLRGVRRFPWLCNVLLYGGLFAAGDAAQQLLRGQQPDWAQTRRVTGECRRLPRRAPRPARGAAPAAGLGTRAGRAGISLFAFFLIVVNILPLGMSILQRKEDIFSDCRKKFWNTYKTGLMYWPFVQLSNFILIPVHLRTAYTGLCGFGWATFICFSQQSGDGTAKSAFMWLQGEKVNAEEESDK